MDPFFRYDPKISALILLVYLHCSTFIFIIHYDCFQGPGIFFVIPCIDHFKCVDLRTVSFDVPPQEVKIELDMMTILRFSIGHFSPYGFPIGLLGNSAEIMIEIMLFAGKL